MAANSSAIDRRRHSVLFNGKHGALPRHCRTEAAQRISVHLIASVQCQASARNEGDEQWQFFGASRH